MHGRSTKQRRSAMRRRALEHLRRREARLVAAVARGTAAIGQFPAADFDEPRA